MSTTNTYQAWVDIRYRWVRRQTFDRHLLACPSSRRWSGPISDRHLVRPGRCWRQGRSWAHRLEHRPCREGIPIPARPCSAAAVVGIVHHWPIAKDELALSITVTTADDTLLPVLIVLRPSAALLQEGLEAHSDLLVLLLESLAEVGHLFPRWEFRPSRRLFRAMTALASSSLPSRLWIDVLIRRTSQLTRSVSSTNRLRLRTRLASSESMADVAAMSRDISDAVPWKLRSSLDGSDGSAVAAPAPPYRPRMAPLPDEVLSWIPVGAREMGYGGGPPPDAGPFFLRPLGLQALRDREEFRRSVLGSHGDVRLYKLCPFPMQRQSNK